MASTHAVIDLNKKLVIFYDELLAVPINSPNRHQNYLRTSNHTVLPPQSETIVLVHTCQPVHIKFVALVAPLSHSSKTKYWVARHVTPLHTSQTYYGVYNTHNTSIWIRKYTSYRHLEHVHNDSVLTSIDAQNPTQHVKKHNDNMSILHDLGITLTNDNVSDHERQQLTDLLTRNEDTFATDLSQLLGCSISKHTIRTRDAPPQRQRSYKHFPAARMKIEKQTADMLANDIIEPSDSIWTSHVVLVKKKI